MFVKTASGERFNVLKQTPDGAWVISCDDIHKPTFVNRKWIMETERAEPPNGYGDTLLQTRSLAEETRRLLIAPLLQDDRCIIDSRYRNQMLKHLAETQHTTVKRLRTLYFRYLATGTLMSKKPSRKKRRKDFDEAIQKYYFSATKNSLRTAYELMILESYTNCGDIQENIPTWASFRQYYSRYWGKSIQRSIAQNGLTNYQRNERMLYGSAMGFRDAVGSYQIDETLADIFLVSKFDRSKVIGRPYIYLAVDTCTQLIAGVHITMRAGAGAVLACVANCVEDKVAYCASLGISIKPQDWPSKGMPAELITDKGSEFVGDKVANLCIRYGVDIHTLPPFRADEKSLVERNIGLLQDSYRSMVQGKGGIGKDVNERWGVDYRAQAVLTIEEYTKMVVHCIVALNKSRILKDIGHLPVDAPHTPAGLWEWFLKQDKSKLLHANAQEVYVYSLPREKIKLTRKGIQFHQMRYLPPREEKYSPGDTVEIAYDEQNPNMVYIINATDKMLIPCELAPSNARYKGYDASDIQIIKEQERVVNQKYKRIELEGKVEMRKHILDILGQAKQLTPPINTKDLTPIKQEDKREIPIRNFCDPGDI